MRRNRAPRAELTSRPSTGMKRVLLLFLALFFFLSFPSFTPAFSQESKISLPDSAGYCEELLNLPAKKTPRPKLLHCLKRFQGLARDHVKGSSSPAIWLKVGQIYERLYSLSRSRRELDGAIAAYRRLVKGQLNNNQAAEAFFRLGRALYKAGRKAEGKEQFQKLLSYYPESPWVREARAFLPREATNRRLFVGSPGPKNEGVQVYGIRYWTNPDYTRVVIDLEQEVKFSYNLLAAPEGTGGERRLYLDMEGSKLGPEVKETLVGDAGPLKRVRAAQYRPDAVRIVLDINGMESYKVFPLRNPFRLVIDLSSGEQRGLREKVPSLPVPPRVVIDPGHGGDDPGAVGKDGLQEKEVALKISKKLKELLSRELGAQVLLTREDDVFVPLEARTVLANSQGADLFISIHANASLNQGVRGIETYYLNLSTDPRSLEVAARENATTIQGLSDLQLILADLLLNSKIQESSRLAASIHGAVISQTKARNLGVKQAPFYVLLGAQMPSVLLEASFITNREDSRLLKDDGFINSFAMGVLEGIKRYLDGQAGSLSANSR